MEVLALPGGLLHEVIVGKTRHQVGKAKTHTTGRLKGIEQAVVVSTAVVAQADAGVSSLHLHRRLEDVDWF